MHIADVDKGMLGANGIVGGGLPLARRGADGEDRTAPAAVAVCFFGDGASNQGTFHEALNLAAIWKLPVVFVCENNGYAESTPFDYHCSASDIANRAAGYDIPGVVVDGLDSSRSTRPRAKRSRGAARRRSDADRSEDLSLLRALPGRRSDLSDRRGARGATGSATRSQAFVPHVIERRASPPRPSSTRSTHESRRRTVDEAWPRRQAAPWPEPEEALDRRLRLATEGAR